jgi:hypothetical protein
MQNKKIKHLSDDQDRAISQYAFRHKTTWQSAYDVFMARGGQKKLGEWGFEL